MKKLTSSAHAAAQDPRVRARLVLAFVASVLVLLLGLMGMSSGPNGAALFAQESPSPTPTESPTEEPPPSTEPAIKLINPSDETPQVTGARPDDDQVSVSDRDDGANTTYHIVAWAQNVPAGAVVEAYYIPKTAGGVELPEITIGLMDRVAATPDTWEFHWDIPEPPTVPEGNGKITVRMFGNVAGGLLEVVAEDSVDVRMRHSSTATPASGGDGAPADVTTEITWPSNGGELGFYKPRGGAWRTIIDATRSSGNSLSYFFYTVSAPGTDPEWKQCATATGTGATRTTCTLVDGDLPSQVTAVYTIVTEDQEPEPLLAVRIIESGDAHRVRPYIQEVPQMRLELSAFDTVNTNGTFRQVVGSDPDTGEPHRCLAIMAEVFDHLDREVQGVNLDAHATGPSDQIQFGDEDFLDPFAIFDDASSAYKVPDKGVHSVEPGENCDRESDGEQADETHSAKPLEGQQGDHNVPGGSDLKHRESVSGTGLDNGSAGLGQWLFHVWSPDVGETNVTVWIDEQPIGTETETRAPDTDLLETTETSQSVRLQWLPNDITVEFDPPGDTAQVGTCNKYTVKVRGGNVPVRGINVDVHATGPNNELDFCDPGDGTPRRAPDNTGVDEDHEAEDEGEAHHRGDPPQTQHTEGETDDAGNFVIGITSPISGDTTLQAWVDGERGSDDDTLDSDEPSGRATKSWAASLADAQVSFVNPSAYGGSGTNVSNKEDVDRSYHIVTRVDAFDAPGVQLYISSDDGATFAFIGDATRVGASDTWEFPWSVNVPDGDYVLRAQITGTTKTEDQDIVVNNEDATDDDPSDFAFETLEITRPANAQGAPFTNRETVVEGVTSDGAEGVDLFYTKVAAKDTPQSADWIPCGFVAPKEDDSFSGTCRLSDNDQASSVTGLAALTYDCLRSSCNPAPGTTTTPREPGFNDSGDAHRVFGFEGRPIVSIEPAETAGEPGTCQRFVLSVVDETGQAIADQNVDVHLTGPTDESSFCTPDTGASPRRAPDQGQHATVSDQDQQSVHEEETPNTKHTEGETGSNGRFSFGITSPTAGDSRILGWVDQNDNDVHEDEPSDTSLMHWDTGDGGGGSGQPACTISGDSGNNTLRGTAGDDVICGFGGKDTIHGLGGNDIIRGGKGHDDLRGNVGDDEIYGGGGLDILRGGDGSDILRGNSQDDVIRGYTGNDRLIGGGGDDTLRAGRGRDVLRGKAGNDTLNGGRGFDRCNGGRGRDITRNCER